MPQISITIFCKTIKCYNKVIGTAIQTYTFCILGPNFQIQTQNGLGTCLSAAKTSSAEVTVEECKDVDYQKWAWTSKSRIKNIENQQCLAISGTTEINVITADCDNSDKQQIWKYYHKNFVLQFVEKKQYLNYRKDNKKLRLHTTRGLDSQWLALLDIGETTSLKNLQSKNLI